MNKVRSLKQQLVLTLGIPLAPFLAIDTVLSYFVTRHYVNEAYDRWLVDSAKSLIQEIRVRNDKAFVDLPLVALEMFTWDEVDKIRFKIVSERSELLSRRVRARGARTLVRSRELVEAGILRGANVRRSGQGGFDADRTPRRRRSGLRACRRDHEQAPDDGARHLVGRFGHPVAADRLDRFLSADRRQARITAFADIDRSDRPALVARLEPYP